MNLRTLTLPVLLAALAPCVQAQELGRGGFKLVVGSFSGAEDAGLGQNKNYGLAVFGSYFISTKGSLEFEGGFRYDPRAEAADKTNPNLVYSHKMNIYYFGVTYRHQLPVNGLFVQGGLRASRAEVHEDVTDTTNATASYARTGPHDTSVKPTLGVGYTFDERYSVTFGAVSMKTQNAVPAPNTGTKSGTMLELSLLIRM